MAKKDQQKNVIGLIRSSVSALYANPLIFYPFCVTAFIQLIILEVFYFAPRYPLVIFFGPIIKTIWSELFLHYPYNLILLPKLFQLSQIVIFLFISSFLISVAIAIIAAINNDKKITFKSALRQVTPQYVHIVLAAVLVFLTYFGFSSLYGFIIKRALLLRSKAGLFYIIKLVIIEGASYVNLLIGVLVTTIFAFVFIIIVVERKKVFAAIFLNFKYLWRSFWFLFMVVLIPTIFFVPVLLLRNNVEILTNGLLPEFRVLVIILSIVVMVLIDSIVYTSIATYYLLKRENS